MDLRGYFAYGTDPTRAGSRPRSRNGSHPAPGLPDRVPGIRTSGPLQRPEDRSPAEQAEIDRIVAWIDDLARRFGL